MKTIVISGKNGQLGWELKRLSSSFPQYKFVFCDKSELDITSPNQVGDFFSEHKPDVFVNCAAYTAVDKAETDQLNAYKANAEAVGFIATQCQLHDALFITFSTDYVFEGNGITPYKENQATEPLNYYGYTKAEGEKLALQNWNKTIIIRTSWVYSTHGNNFVKTMLRLMNERNDINVVKDQIGSPTYAKDLAEATMMIIEASKLNYGVYHFSNEGIISWFDFAEEIKQLADLNCTIHPITTSEFPTPAKRPAYSVLEKRKIMNDFNIRLKNWKESLAECIKEILNEKSGS